MSSRSIDAIWLKQILTFILMSFSALSYATAVTAPNLSPTANLKTSKITELSITQQLQQQNTRLLQLEQANQDALSHNQELQLINDNLSIQVQVLQSERSAQMFLYGGATLAVGAFIGFLLANLFIRKQTRRW